MAITYGSSGLGVGAQRRRRGQQLRGRLARAALALTILGALMGYAYQVGASRSEAVIAQLQDEIGRLQTNSVVLSEQAAAAVQMADAARERARALEQRYAALVPQEAERELLALIAHRLADGVPPERLAFALEQTGARECAALPEETRRFLIRTPITREPIAAARFGDGRILVSGEAASARTAQGLPEAWFDPAEPVTLRFQIQDGRSETVEGVLPLDHAMVVGGREYRFRVAGTDRRGFVETTAQSCAFP